MADADADEPKEGWLGTDCPKCKGTGEFLYPGDDNYRACNGCGGTGEAYGPLPR